MVNAMRTLLSLVVASGFLLPASARAQEGGPGVPPGSRVRVTSTAMFVERWVTRLDSAHGDTLFFVQREGGAYGIPVRLIDRLEVSDGIGYSRGLRTLHVGLGYVGGVIGGTIIGAATGAEPPEAVKGAAILGVFTAIIAYREPGLGRGERWRPVVLSAPRGVGVSVLW